MTDDYTEPLLPHEVLARARKDMAQYGKAKGVLFDIPFLPLVGMTDENFQQAISHACREAPRCLLGAIKGARGQYDITSFPASDDPAMIALVDAINQEYGEVTPEKYGDPFITVYGWNDGIGMTSAPTKEEAVAMLEKAEALAFTRLVEGS